MRISCCYGCEDRKVGCHGTCEKYIEECKQWKEQKDFLKAKNANVVGYSNFSYNNVMHSGAIRKKAYKNKSYK